MNHARRVSRSIAQKSNLDGFVKPGELVDVRAGAGLSLQDRRIFNLLIEHAWAEIGESKTHRIAISRLRGPRHESGDRVAESVDTLMTTLVKVPAMLEGQPAVLSTQLLGPTTRTLDEDSPKALLEYEFPEKLRKVIQESRYWGRIKSHVMFAFSSKYALALYEAVCLRANLRVDSQDFSVEDFRALLSVEDTKYPAFPQLKQRVLDPAVAEVNALSDFNVEIQPLREGGMLRGKLVGFRLFWEKKTQEQWRTVLDELLRPKIGRKARIRGVVEHVA
jgi:hypothetical protein